MKRLHADPMRSMPVFRAWMARSAHPSAMPLEAARQMCPQAPRLRRSACCRTPPAVRSTVPWPASSTLAAQLVLPAPGKASSASVSTRRAALTSQRPLSASLRLLTSRWRLALRKLPQQPTGRIQHTTKSRLAALTRWMLPSRAWADRCVLLLAMPAAAAPPMSLQAPLPRPSACWRTPPLARSIAPWLARRTLPALLEPLAPSRVSWVSASTRRRRTRSLKPALW